MIPAKCLDNLLRSPHGAAWSVSGDGVGADSGAGGGEARGGCSWGVGVRAAVVGGGGFGWW